MLQQFIGTTASDTHWSVGLLRLWWQKSTAWGAQLEAWEAETAGANA